MEPRNRSQMRQPRIPHRLHVIGAQRRLVADDERHGHAARCPRQFRLDAPPDRQAKGIEPGQHPINRREADCASVDLDWRLQREADPAQPLEIGLPSKVEGIRHRRWRRWLQIGLQPDPVADQQRLGHFGKFDANTRRQRPHIERPGLFTADLQLVEHDPLAAGIELDLDDASRDLGKPNVPRQLRCGRPVGTPSRRRKADCRRHQAGTGHYQQRSAAQRKGRPQGKSRGQRPEP